MLKVSFSQVMKQTLQLQGELPPTAFELPGKETEHGFGDVAYDLSIRCVSGGMLVQGMVNSSINANCARCLRNFDWPVKPPEICHFYENPEEETDLSPDLREDLLIDLPIKFICREDCAGLCPKCGADLNLSPCTCHEDISGNDVWKELDNLDKT